MHRDQSYVDPDKRERMLRDQAAFEAALRRAHPGLNLPAPPRRVDVHLPNNCSQQQFEAALKFAHARGGEVVFPD